MRIQDGAFTCRFGRLTAAPAPGATLQEDAGARQRTCVLEHACDGVKSGVVVSFGALRESVCSAQKMPHAVLSMLKTAMSKQPDVESYCQLQAANTG